MSGIKKIKDSIIYEFYEQEEYDSYVRSEPFLRVIVNTKTCWSGIKKITPADIVPGNILAADALDYDICIHFVDYSFVHIDPVVSVIVSKLYKEILDSPVILLQQMNKGDEYIAKQ